MISSICYNAPTLGIVAERNNQTNYKQINNVKRNTNGNCAKRVLKNGFIMTKIGIIGNGSIASSIVVKLQDTELKIVETQEEINPILEQGTTMYIKNTYHHLDSRSPSKTQLRKCEKGLHEFKESNYTSDKDGMLVTKKEWFCQHCGINMRNRG